MLLHHHITGSGKAVVVIHGLFGSYENLGALSRALAEHWQVISLDVRNHGQSPHHPQMSYPLMANDVLETLTNLGISQASFIGHSMGGKIAMEFALRYPQHVNKLVLADIAPVSYQQRRHSNIFAGLNAVDLLQLQSRTEADKQLAQYVNEAGVRQFLLKSLHKHQQHFQWRFNLPVLEQHYDALMTAPSANGQFTNPVLFIKGSESDYILPEHRPDILARFPNAQAKIIQGTGHWLHAEKPAAFTKIVKDFLLS